MRPTSNIFDTAARYCIYTVIFLAPWLHGAEQTWEQLFCSAVIFMAVVLVLAGKRPFLLPGKQAVWIIGLFGLWLVYCAFYLLPLPLDLIAALSPANSGITDSASPVRTHLTVYWQASFLALCKYSALVALFIVVITVFQGSDRMRQLAWVLVTSSGATAVYSQLNFLTHGQFEIVSAIPPWDFSWQEGIRGTFSYKNQYALYLVMNICITVGLLADALLQRRKHRNISWTPVAILVIVLGLLLITLLNTSSRGALLSLLLGGGMTGLLLVRRNRSLTTRLFNKKVIAASVVALVVATAGFTQSSIYERFTSEKMADNGRAMLWQTAADVLVDYPVTGSGPGTYPYIQHQYKPLLLGNSQMSKRAHNDYLETLATHGVLGAALLLLPLFLLTITLLSTSLTATSAGLLMGCQAAILAYLIQAAFDVNAGVFLLPVLFILLLGTGWNIVRQSRQQIC